MRFLLEENKDDFLRGPPHFFCTFMYVILIASGFVLSILAIFGMAEEPKFDKYMPEQRISYIYFTGVSTFVLIITGILKVYKNLPDVTFSAGTVTILTTLHNIATFMFLFSLVFHLGAFVLKATARCSKKCCTRLICIV